MDLGKIILDIISICLQLILAIIGLIIGHVPSLLFTMAIEDDPDNLDNFNDYNKVNQLFWIPDVLFGIFITIIIPVYLNLSGWWLVVVLILGGAIFFCLGVGSLLRLLWGDKVGNALGTLGFAILEHYISVAIWPNPNTVSIMKILVVITLFESIAYLSASFVTSTGSHYEPISREGGKKIAQWAGAIITFMEFFNIIFGLLEKIIKK